MWCFLTLHEGHRVGADGVGCRSIPTVSRAAALVFQSAAEEGSTSRRRERFTRTALIFTVPDAVPALTVLIHSTQTHDITNFSFIVII